MREEPLPVDERPLTGFEQMNTMIWLNHERKRSDEVEGGREPGREGRRGREAGESLW